MTVIDAQLPVITCPANIVKPTDPGQCSAVANYTVTASDNCTYTLTRTSPASGAPSNTRSSLRIADRNWVTVSCVDTAS